MQIKSQSVLCLVFNPDLDMVVLQERVIEEGQRRMLCGIMGEKLAHESPLGAASRVLHSNTRVESNPENWLGFHQIETFDSITWCMAYRTDITCILRIYDMHGIDISPKNRYVSHPTPSYMEWLVPMARNLLRGVQ